MKRIYRVQKTTIPKGHNELAEIKKYTLFSSPLKALLRMEMLAYGDFRRFLGENLTATMTRISDERYPDAWGMANNGILVESAGTQIQWEVIEEN